MTFKKTEVNMRTKLLAQMRNASEFRKEVGLKGRWKISGGTWCFARWLKNVSSDL